MLDSLADTKRTQYLRQHQYDFAALSQRFAHFETSFHTAERRRTSALFVCAPFAAGFGGQLQKEGPQLKFLRSIVSGLWPHQ